jgi:UDP-N-acetylglucosamine 2-epimerase (non-hydrolysing)
MRNVMTIVGTRPEIIKLCRVIAELEHNTNHTLAHTGQNYDYELNEIFFDELGVKRPDFFMEAAGQTPAETIANVIAKSDKLLAEVKPDCLLVYGDTNSCLAAIAAKRRQIPVFHMEAGNRCFDERVPEEINRRIIDHLSDINLTITEHARRYLLAEGIRPETVIKVGSSMPEVLDFYREQIDASDALSRLGLKTGEYFLVSCHREENVDYEDNFDNFLDTLHALTETFDKSVIVSTHPRTRKRLESRAATTQDKRIEFLKPLGFCDYITLQEQAFCVVSDSGTITEESSILGFPAVTIRQAHERPEGMDEGTVIMSGTNPAAVTDSVRVVTSQVQRGLATRRVFDYDTPNVSLKVVRIILSYIDYVNRTVWRKPS